MSHNDAIVKEQGEAREDRIGAALDHFIGTWSKPEADSFLKSIASCEKIDPA
jgi:hypothetical protein